MIFTGQQIVAAMRELGISHVVWVPDSDMGQWEADIEASDIELIRVCREGEAWPLAAGLLVHGKTPLVMLQTTGLFESGDALRNVVYDLGLPVFAIVGARNWLNATSRDSAKRFAEPILKAWSIDYRVVASERDRPKLPAFYRQCRDTRRPGLLLMAE